MNSTLSFFADENISLYLIKWIGENGYIISGVIEESLCGATDISIIQKCFIKNEIILTHDNDFGKIIFTNRIPFYSIIYLRTGHFDAGFHIPTLKSIFKKKELIGKGTLIIGHRTVDKIKIRIKQIEIKI
jgi:predicted nuclease of predicted toxin-antitoxin system